MKTSVALLFVLLIITCVFSGCETPGQTAMLGAATGAVIGNQSYTGPLRGAAIGAGAGYLIGKLIEHDRRDRYYYDDDDRYVYRDRSYHTSRYPVARPTNRRGFVTSPYSPHHLIDVRGIPRGAKVADPSNDRIFINP